MAPSSHSSPHRFYEYLKCLQEVFEHRFTDDMSSPRRFNIYLGNLKGEFELMSLEIESLQKERDEYRERAEAQMKKLQNIRLNFVCDRCRIGTTSASQTAVPSSSKAINTGLRPYFQPQSPDKTSDPSKDVDLNQETTTRRSDQHTTIIQKLRSAITPTRPSLSSIQAVTKVSDTPAVVLPSPGPSPRASDSTTDRPKGRRRKIEFSNKVEKELDVKIAHTLSHAKPMRCVKFSQDGKYLAAGCKDGRAYIYDVQGGTLACVLRNLLAKEDRINAVCFSPNGKFLATGAWNGALYIWEINTKYVRNAFKGHTRHINSLNFSPNGRLLVSTSDDSTVRLWNMRDGATRLLTDVNPTIIDEPCYASAVFSPDGMYVAASHRDGMVRIWNVCKCELTRTIQAHLRWASCVAFMPDGKGLVSGGWDDRLRYWDVSSLDSIRISARSRMAKTSHREALGMEELTRREFRGGKEDFVYSLAISPDGRWVASSAESVHIWDTRNAATQCTLNHNDSVYSVDFSPTGCYLASGGNDGLLKIWKYSNIAFGDSLVHGV